MPPFRTQLICEKVAEQYDAIQLKAIGNLFDCKDEQDPGVCRSGNAIRVG